MQQTGSLPGRHAAQRHAVGRQHAQDVPQPLPPQQQVVCAARAGQQPVRGGYGDVDELSGGAAAYRRRGQLPSQPEKGALDQPGLGSMGLWVHRCMVFFVNRCDLPAQQSGPVINPLIPAACDKHTFIPRSPPHAPTHTQICHVPGITLHIDFPFPGYPDNLGHWAEIMWPTFSVFATREWADTLREEGEEDQATAGSTASSGRSSGAFVSRVLLANINAHLLDWFRETLAVALAPALPPGAPPGGLPPVVEEPSLADYSKQRWILFERLAVVQDRYPLLHALEREAWLAATRGSGAPLHSNAYRTGFATPALARRFREAAYRQAGWPLGWRARDRAVERAVVGDGDGGGGSGGLAGEAAADGSSFCAAAAAEGNGGGSAGLCGSQDTAPAAAAAGGGGGGLPRMVTVMLDPDHYPPITNHHALVERLEDVAGRYGFKVGGWVRGTEAVGVAVEGVIKDRGGLRWGG